VASYLGSRFLLRDSVNRFFGERMKKNVEIERLSVHVGKKKKKKNCFRVWKSAWKLQWHFVGVVDTYPTNLCVWKYMRFNSSGPVLVRIKQGIRVEKRTMCFVFWCVQENVRFWLQCGVQKFASTRPNASIAPFNSKPKFSTP
jgi:hypothetical protein